jgi:hypothetical protein
VDYELESILTLSGVNQIGTFITRCHSPVEGRMKDKNAGLWLAIFSSALQTRMLQLTELSFVIRPVLLFILLDSSSLSPSLLSFTVNLVIYD